jgi:predicted RNA-binding protein
MPALASHTLLRNLFNSPLLQGRMPGYVAHYEPAYRDSIREYLEKNDIQVRVDSQKRRFVSFDSTEEQAEKIKSLEGIVSIREDYQFSMD